MLRKTFYEDLSNHFCGTIISSTTKQEIMDLKKIGDFNLRCIPFNKGKKVLSNIRFILWSIMYCLVLRFRKGKIHLVITYDPFKTGLIGWVCSRILDAKLVVEVNGVYTSPAVFMDEPNNFFTIVKRRAFPLIESFVLRRSAGIKLLFPEQLVPLKKHFQDKVIHSFPCHVEIDPFLNFTGNEEKREILFAGFPFKLKGVDILIAAFKLISEKYPDWSLKILGWFPDKTELQKAIDGHPRIEVHLPVFYSEMPEHICKCSIFVLPSRTEAMGRVLVEAMAAGKPRVGANVDGIPTVINDGVDGLLFKSEDIQDLAQKLELVMEDPKLRRKMGTAGRKRAIRDFSSTVYFKHLFDFYSEVLLLK